MPKTKKKVRFAEGTKDPPPPLKCRVCGFRKIRPFRQAMYECYICRGLACVNCIFIDKQGIYCSDCD